jgi:putative membrane protein
MRIFKTFKTLNIITFICLSSLPLLSTAQNKPQLTDPEIASVAVTANQIDMGYADIAIAKSKDTSILDFARTMKRDHQAIIDQAVALVTKLGVTPKDNPVTQSLLSGAAKTKQMLNSKSGKAFDKAYIDNEVAYHKTVISTVNDVLIPEAQNAELKALLQKIVPLLNAHLSHAEMLQKNF